MQHVNSQYRASVVEAGLLVQAEGGRQPVSTYHHIVGQQAVGGGRFFRVAGQQAFNQQAADAVRRGAAQGERVELVEVGGPGGWHHADLATLGGVGIHIRKMGETGGVLDVPKLGVGVRSPGG